LIQINLYRKIPFLESDCHKTYIHQEYMRLNIHQSKKKTVAPIIPKKYPPKPILIQPNTTIMIVARIIFSRQFGGLNIGIFLCKMN